MIGLDRDLGQDAHPQAGRDRGLDAREIGGGIGDMPGAAGAFQRVNHAIAVEAAGESGSAAADRLRSTG